MGSVQPEETDLSVTPDGLSVAPASPSQSWQAFRSDFCDRGKYLLENDTLSDVVFVVGKGVIQQEIPAHRFILAMGSPVFESMFFGPIRQMSHPADGPDLRIPDIQPDVFRGLLRYLYTDDVSAINSDTVLATLHAAKRYDIPQLQKACLDFMQHHLHPENVFLVLEQAQLAEEDDLIQRCWEIVEQRTSAVLASADFLQLDKDTLALVLRRDRLATTEVELYHAAEKWAHEECNRRGLQHEAVHKRKCLGDLIYDIRFPLMTARELANGPVQSGMLRADEVKTLFLYLFADNKPEIAFATHQRTGKPTSTLFVSRFSEVGGNWGYAGGADAIQFKVNRKIVLHGVGIYGAAEEDAKSQYEAHVTVRRTADNQLVGENEILVKSDGSKEILKIPLLLSVVIEPDSLYSVTVQLKGPASYRGSGGESQVRTGDDLTLNFSSSSLSENGTSVQDGQIPALFYSFF